MVKGRQLPLDMHSMCLDFFWTTCWVFLFIMYIYNVYISSENGLCYLILIFGTGQEEILFDTETSFDTFLTRRF